MPEGVDLSYHSWFAYGVGHVFNDLCASMWFTYLLIFFVYALKFDNALAGTALFIGQIADGISACLIGLISEKCIFYSLCKYGHRKSWHLLGTICVFFSFPFIYSPCIGCANFSNVQKLVYYCVFIVLFQFGWAATQISHLSLVPDLTPNQHERTSLISLRYSFTVISTMAVYVIFWVILQWNQEGEDSIIGPEDAYVFQRVAYIVVIVGVIMSLIFHVGVKEKNQHTEDDTRQLTESHLSRLSLFQSCNMYNVAVVYVATRLFVNLSQIYIPLYLHSYLQLPSQNLAILPLIIFVSSFLTSIMIKPLNVEFGRTFTYAFGAIIGIGACIWVRLGNENDCYYRMYEIYGVAISFGCASSIMLVTSLGFTADLIGNNNDGAFVYGIMSVFDKISNGVAVLLIEHMKHFVDCESYYREVIIISCGSAAIFGLFAVITIKPTDSIAMTVIRRNDIASENDTVKIGNHSENDES